MAPSRGRLACFPAVAPDGPPLLWCGRDRRLAKTVLTSPPPSSRSAPSSACGTLAPTRSRRSAPGRRSFPKAEHTRALPGHLDTAVWRRTERRPVGWLEQFDQGVLASRSAASRPAPKESSSTTTSGPHRTSHVRPNTRESPHGECEAVCTRGSPSRTCMHASSQSDPSYLMRRSHRSHG